MKSPYTRMQSGFSLVEVTLALGVAAFCILPLVGLLGVGYDANRTSVQQTTAATITSAISADLRATPSSAATTPYFGLTIPSSGTTKTSNLYVGEDGATLNSPSSDQPTYLATVVMTSAAVDTLKSGCARILITWPATPNQINGTIPIRYNNSLETVVGLNQN